MKVIRVGAAVLAAVSLSAKGVTIGQPSTHQVTKGQQQPPPHKGQQPPHQQPPHAANGKGAPGKGQQLNRQAAKPNHQPAKGKGPHPPVAQQAQRKGSKPPGAPNKGKGKGSKEPVLQSKGNGKGPSPKGSGSGLAGKGQQPQHHAKGQPPAKGQAPELVRTPRTPLGLTKPEASLDAVVGDLWDGLDFADNKFSMNSLAVHDPHFDYTHGAEANVQVMGLHNSGTDLLNALLYLNFGYRLQYFVDQVKDEPNHKKGLWRFANIKELSFVDQEKMANLTKDNVKTLVVVRNPISWLRAVRSRPPYELKSCLLLDNQTWQTESCTHPFPVGQGGKMNSKTFNNIVGIWNQWTGGYTRARDFGISQHLVIEFENLVGHPERVMKNIAHFLEIPEPSFFMQPDTEDGDGQKNAGWTMRRKTYLEEFTDHDMKVFCGVLDKELQATYHYEDCESRTYKLL